MLKTPPLLAGAALLFWGWHTGFFFFAVVMAGIVEASRITTARWEFSQSDYNRIWNLCAILFLGVAVYCFASNDGAESVAGMFGARANRTAAMLKTTRSVLLLFQWLPVIFFPVMAAQGYGAKEKIDFSTFSWLLRRKLAGRAAASKSAGPGGVNISFIYFGVCLFAASAEKSDSAWFYPGLGLLIGSALFTQRPKHYPVAVWATVMVLVAALGFGAQFGLRQLHRAIEQLDSMIFSRLAGSAFSAKDSQTSIGSIGRLNLSGRIVLRLESERGDFPEYLREASYNIFRSPTWHATRRNFSGVLSETNETTWVLLPKKESRHSVSLALSLRKGQGLLALPTGFSVLEQLPGALETNRFGAVKIEGLNFLNFRAKYDEGPTIDGLYDEDDLSIPPAEDQALSEVAAQLQLKPDMDTREALRTVNGFFHDNFVYSSYLTGQHQGATNETPLARFLLRQRSGHCEYFATATTLLLRKAGIHARYAVGYAVQETSKKKAVVRERHAHAWCLVYANGIWHDFDTTPSSWAEVEGKHASFWEPFSDAWSRAWFEFSKWRYGKSNWRRFVPWIVAPLILVLVGQLFWRKRARRGHSSAISPPPFWPGLDSEFYHIEQTLAARGLNRRNDESNASWVSRVATVEPEVARTLPDILRLHYRYRFDPTGLSPAERHELRGQVDRWLERYDTPPGSA